MATNSFVWQPNLNAFQVILNPPDKEGGTPGSISMNLNGTPVNPQVTNRVYSSYKDPLPFGPNTGFGLSWWQTAPPVTNPVWNVGGPIFGAGPVVFYVQPTYKDASGAWHQYLTQPSVNGSTYTFTDPSGGGSTSIVITMINPGGGGGLSL